MAFAARIHWSCLTPTRHVTCKPMVPRSDFCYLISAIRFLYDLNDASEPWILLERRFETRKCERCLLDLLNWLVLIESLLSSSKTDITMKMVRKNRIRSLRNYSRINWWLTFSTLLKLKRCCLNDEDSKRSQKYPNACRNQRRSIVFGIALILP